MEHYEIAQYIARAQALGSKATTLRGAGKYVLAHTESLIPSHRRVRRQLLSAAQMRKQMRDVRLIARYAGMRKFPRYLSRDDRATIAQSKAHQSMVRARTAPAYARSFFVVEEVRAIPRLAKEIALMDRAKGQLVNSEIIARDAIRRTRYGQDRRMTANVGISVRPSNVGARESGSYKYWSMRSTFNRVINYSLIAPREHEQKGAWTMYYTDAVGVSRKVFCTQNYMCIQDEIRDVRRVERGKAEPVALPAHIQRRILALVVPRALRVDYDRGAKKLMLVDALGEQYHLYPIAGLASARKQVSEAVSALRRRRAEKIQTLLYPSRVFVELADSYAAGNCRAVSDEFAAKMWREIGAEGPCAVRADVILAARSDSYTRRACAYAATRI